MGSSGFAVQSVQVAGDDALCVYVQVRGKDENQERNADEHEEEEEEIGFDEHFFDPGYSVAGTTGFLLWEGGKRMTARLHELLPQCVDRCRRGAGEGRMLAVELGAGTGVVGIAAAKMGADVILTDLPSVVEGSLMANIALNKTPDSSSDNAHAAVHQAENGARDNATICSDGGERATGGEGAMAQLLPTSTTTDATMMTCVGRGRCCAVALDWEEAEVGVAHVLAATKGACIDVILSAESVWLKELVEPFANAFALLMQRAGGDTIVSSASESSSPPLGLICCRDRSSNDSRTFARPSDVVDALQSRGCSLTLLFREESLEDPGRDLLFYQVRRCCCR